MKTKYRNILSIILPNKKINIFSIILIIIGLSLGSLYSTVLGTNDKTIVIEKITTFITNINNNQINNLHILRNSTMINVLYILSIWLLGLTLIGLIIAIFLLLFKSFILGFTISSFYLTYKYKGIILSILYIINSAFINIMIIFLLSVYSVTFTIKFIKSFKNNNTLDIKKFIKKYLFLLIICLILTTISSLLEAFLFPAILKFIIKLFV